MKNRVLIAEGPISVKYCITTKTDYTLYDNNIVASLRMIFNRVILYHKKKYLMTCASLRYILMYLILNNSPYYFSMIHEK